jgi:phosphohistidine phosphatase SixA
MGTSLSAEQRCVILVRHARRDVGSNMMEAKQSMAGWNPSLEQVQPSYKEKGLPLTLSIANRVLEELGPIKVVQIWHSPHAVAAQTAKAYEWAISSRTQRKCSPKPVPALDPDTGSAPEVVELLAKEHCPPAVPDGSAIILVGHQPMLTAVAGALARNKLPADTLPLGGSEAACIELYEGKAATLLWMLTEKSDDLLKDLKDKIKSKYDVAKFFLGAFVVNTGFLFSSTIWGVSDVVALLLIMAGFVLALIALALTAATLMSYDALQMPTEFWTEPPAGGRRNRRNPRPKKWSVLRPPSQAHVVLFYEMIHVWNAFFIPALVCAFASIASFIVAMVHTRFAIVAGREPGLADLAVMIIVAVAALLVPLVIYYPHNEPKLGFED